MALRDKSLFLYGFSIDNTNQYLDFLNVALGTQIHAVIPASYYTLGTLATAIALAMNTADTTNTYTCTVTRTQSSNLQNRITIATNGAFLSLLFSSGTNVLNSITSVINFGAADKTGATTYTNSLTSGTALQTAWYGMNYTPPQAYQKNSGDVSISASGVKEGISWSTQQFIQVEFRYEPIASVLAYWDPFIQWMILQKPFEFTPETNAPSTVYTVTLEKSPGDGKGLGFMMKEMLPDFPFVHSTGQLEFRVVGLY